VERHQIEQWINNLQRTTRKLSGCLQEIIDVESEISSLHKQNSVLLEQSGRLLNAPGLDDAYAIIRALAGQLFPGQPGVLYLCDSPTQPLQPRVGWGDPPPAATEFDSDACLAIRDQKPYLTLGDGRSPVCGHADRGYRGATLCVPMWMKKYGLLGVFHLRAPASGRPGPNGGPDGPFPEPMRRLAESVALHITSAVENLRLREDLRHQAEEDAKTGLHNHGWMEKRLEQDVARAKRGNGSVGVIVLDIDHFKELNTSYTLAGGDAVLKGVANALRYKFARREGLDAACRSSERGDEFVLILPDMTLDRARGHAERIRAGVREVRVEHEGRVIPPEGHPVTASLGVAAFPDHGQTWREVYRAATVALQTSKEQGRDRVTVPERPTDRRWNLEAFVESARGVIDTPAFREWVGGTRVTLAIVFTDVVGSTAVGERLGDERMSAVRQAHFARSRGLIHHVGGYGVKTMGDSFMAVFKSVEEALQYARQLKAATGSEEVRIRAGVHTGPMDVDGEDVFGGTVNFAARVLGAIGKGAEIWLSDRAKQDLDQGRAWQHAQLQWERHDGVEMSGFEGTFTLWSMVE
jgi:diguanylate cyclase (GGDEF)-like protein